MSASDLTRAALLHSNSGAVVSSDGKYRYWLHRRWSKGLGWMVFVMLNPSTADATKDDPTIRRCMKFAKDNGHEGVIVVNLFAWRETDPDNLLAQVHSDRDLVGPENHNYVTLAAELAAQHEVVDGSMLTPGRIVCAWGAHKAATKDSVATVLGWIDAAAFGPTYCLGRTRNGSPRHPLFVPAQTKLERYQ